MKQRYNVLRGVSVLLKIAAAVTFIGSFLSLLRNALISDSLLFIEYGAFMFALAGAIAGLLMWATAEFIMVQVNTEENTRATAILLRRLVQHQVPTEEPEYMKSLHGIWDDGSPPARSPANMWRRVPVSEEMNTVSVNEKHRVYRRPSDSR